MYHVPNMPKPTICIYLYLYLKSYLWSILYNATIHSISASSQQGSLEASLSSIPLTCALAPTHMDSAGALHTGDIIPESSEDY